MELIVYKEALLSVSLEKAVTPSMYQVRLHIFYIFTYQYNTSSSEKIIRHFVFDDKENNLAVDDTIGEEEHGLCFDRETDFYLWVQACMLRKNAKSYFSMNYVKPAG